MVTFKAVGGSSLSPVPSTEANMERAEASEIGGSRVFQ